MKTRLSFVRHGHVFNPKNIFYGRLPGFRLSEKGIKQARSVAIKLKDCRLSAIFSSPLLRARQTAREIIKYHPALTLKTSIHLNEIFTPFEGFPSITVDTRRGDVYTGTAPPFEQPIDIIHRVQKFIIKIRKAYQGRHIAAVTHGDVIVFMTLWAGKKPLLAANKLNLAPLGISDGYPAPGSITRYTFETNSTDERPQVSYLRPY